MGGEFMSGQKGLVVACRFIGAIFLIVFLTAIPVFAQTSGTILGTVKDASGGLVAGANVAVTNSETGLTRDAVTGDDGAYRFSALPVGHYEVRIEKAGFKATTRKGIMLDVSQEVVTNLALEVGAAATEVTVTGDAPVVNTTNGTLGGLVDEQKIAELPLNGRNYLDLTLLQPGVSQATTVINLGGGTQGAIYSSNGAPIISNSFLLDGTPMQTVFGFNGASASGTTLGVDGIREYKVVTNAFPAEYGMNMGSQMTIISKNGTNHFHGDVFEYLRNRVLDARNFFDNYYQTNPGKRSPQYERNNFGGAFGGPIRKDKTFFWGVYEGLRQVKGIPVSAITIPAGCVSNGTSPAATNTNGADYTVTSADCFPNGGGAIPGGSLQVNAAIQPLLALYAPANANYTFTSPESVHYGQMRVDHTLTKADNIFARYTIEQAYEVVPGPGNDSSNAVPYGFKQFKDTWTSRNQYVTLSESHLFSSQLLNSLRVSFSRTNVPTNYIITDPAVTVSSGPDAVSFKGGGAPMGLLVIGSSGNGAPGQITTMGPDLASPNYHLQNYSSLGDDLFYSRGKHALKFGVLINHINLVIGETVFDRGRVNFGGGLVSFLQNQPTFEFGAIAGGRHRDTLTIEPFHVTYASSTMGVRTDSTSPSAATTVGKKRAASEAHGVMNVGFTHDFDQRAGHISIDGHTDHVEDALRVAQSFGRTLNRGWELTGNATASLHWDWNGATPRHWNGHAEVANAQLQAAGLNQPLDLTKTSLTWKDGLRTATIADVDGFGANWNGTISEDSATDFEGGAKWRFQLRADHLDAAELDRWIGPRARPGWLQRLLPSLLGGAPQTPNEHASELVRRINADGELRVDEFTMEKLKFQQVRADASLDDLHLDVHDADAQWAGGKVHGRLSAKFLPRPAYEVTTDLDQVNLAQLPAPARTAERFAGTASGTLHFTTQGVGRDELLARLTGRGDVRMRNIEFRGWDVSASVAEGEPRTGESRWAAGEGTFTLRDRGIILAGIRLESGREATLVKGTVSFGRDADLTIQTSTDGRREIRTVEPGHILKISGPLDIPRVSVENTAAHQPAD